MVVACVAAGCGGGDPDGSATVGQAAADDHRKRTALDAGSPSWTPIAPEGQAFDVSGTTTIRYGSGSTWIMRTVTGRGLCTNAYFGNDPLFGVVKRCEIEVPSPSEGWTHVADESQSFAIAGTRTVRYGAGSNWVSRTVSGNGECSNAYFGSDPLFGTVKRCEVDASPATTWTQVAAEGETFVMNGAQTVRYGSGSSWISKVVSGPGACSNAYFGGDPLYGVVKRCEAVDPATGPGPLPPAPAPQAAVCTAPISLVDTSAATPTVGNGTPGSCTEAALRSAIAQNAVVTFDCGPAPVTIPVSSTISIPTDRNTVIDGKGLVTLDGGNGVRILSMIRLDYRTNSMGLTIQRMKLSNGRAAGTGYVPQNPANPKCAYGYSGGSGAAIEVRDARLHVIDVDFEGNAAATPGPDVGGGAIYAMGALDVTIVGSRFIGNTGSNNGAVSLLQADARIYNSLFRGNTATGSGMNYGGAEVASCPGIGHPGQGGAGGNSGAVGIDGDANMDVVVCGSRFVDNRANELGGAIGRTINGAPRRTVIDRSLFQNNRARQAGAAYIQNASPLDIHASSFVGNVAAEAAGAAQFVVSKLDIVNSTFSDNEATRGVGGALMLNANDPASSMLNVTFAGNRSAAGSGYFSAAIFGDLNFPVRNTVFSDNLTNDGGGPMQCTFTPAVGSGNVQWPRLRPAFGTPDTPCVAGIAFIDPLLGASADNGGPTPTKLPAPSSPLRGAGRDCPATDQRGSPRNPAQCTAGAVE